MTTQGGKLVLAFDCLKTKQNLKNAIHSANALSKQMGWDAEGISVISPEQINWPTSFTDTWREEFQKRGNEVLKVFLKKNQAQSKLHSKLVMQTALSRRETVGCVIAEARRQGAAAIAVFTHAHEKSFAVPGGFISALIHRSPIPVLALNSMAPAIQKIKTIYVATDFSKEGAASFRKAVGLAEKLGATVVLAHVLPTYVDQMFIASASMAGGWTNVQAYLTAEEAQIKAKAKRWIAQAEKRGVKAQFDIQSGSQSVSESLIRGAEIKKADLIVVTQKTGPLESFVLGSVTRQILAHSTRPVLVMPTRAKMKAGK